MKRPLIFRLLSAVFAVALLAVLLVACNKKAPAAPIPQTPTDPMMGSLLLTFNSEFSISYDTDGNVLYINGGTQESAELLELYTNSQGKSCATVVSELIQLQLASDHMLYRTVVIKQTLGSKTPSATFIADIAKAAEEAATDCTVFSYTLDQLDEGGFLKYEAVDSILRCALNLDPELKFPSATYPTSDMYNFTVPVDEKDVEYYVHANTGAVATAKSLGLDIDAEDYIPNPDIWEPDYSGEYIPNDEDIYGLGNIYEEIPDL